MLSVSLKWRIYEESIGTVTKHCKMCGKLSVFTDTKVRRHNANGKSIYQYAIYKCEKNHTWNQKLAVYKTFSEHHARNEEQTVVHSILSEISITSLASKGIKVIEIGLDDVTGKHRIDQVLANQIDDWSRAQIIEKIKKGAILLNEQVVKPSSRLAKGARISIFIDY
ncbi:hypothetical protein BTS2_1568 [Bacillus sp. TS-2]|nr:hypothetical protein BTS2_1568 [Bacillus sp. TS-2]